jgi:hypothetical protein
MDPVQRSRLLATKLRALAAVGADAPTEQPGFGAALVSGGIGWVLCESPTIRDLGGPVIWAANRGLERLRLIVDPADEAVAGILARRATCLSRPVEVFTVAGTALVAVSPSPFPPASAPVEGVESLKALLAAEGCEVVEEHGVVRGEVLGLEVARIETAAEGGAAADGAPGEPRLECGIGRFDREAGALLRSDLDAAGSLQTVVEVVRAQRWPGAELHPLRDLCRERWMRVALSADPSVLDAAAVTPIPAVHDRPNLRDPAPAFAIATHDDEDDELVVCSVGADVDLVPATAEMLVASGLTRVVVVTPDASPIPAVAVKALTWLPAESRVVVMVAPWTAAAVS